MSGGYGQEEKTDLGRGWAAMGSGPAVVDHLASQDRVAALRAELAALDQQLRNLQATYAARLEQLARLEAGEAT